MKIFTVRIVWRGIQHTKNVIVTFRVCRVTSIELLYVRGSVMDCDNRPKDHKPCDSQGHHCNSLVL